MVTSFEFALHPMRREVVSGDAIFPLAKMRDVLAVYADIVQDSPDELYVDFMATSPLCKPDGMCMLHACWSGEHSQAELVVLL